MWCFMLTQSQDQAHFRVRHKISDILQPSGEFDLPLNLGGLYVYFDQHNMAGLTLCPFPHPLNMVVSVL